MTFVFGAGVESNQFYKTILLLKRLSKNARGAIHLLASQSRFFLLVYPYEV